MVIPQRAVYEILAKRYVYVLEEVSAQTHPPASPPSHPGTEVPGEQEVSMLTEPPAEDKHHLDGEAEAKPGEHTHHARGVVRQREIEVQDEQEDIFLIKSGLAVNDKIILEGIRQVRDGDVVEYEYKSPAEVLVDLKYHAE